MVAGWATQEGHAFRFDWGLDGLQALVAGSAVVVIVDVLRFTTAVSVAVDVGASVAPDRWDDSPTAERDPASLSPSRFMELGPGVRTVVPSPNGSALSVAARDAGAGTVLAGCLRNARATARAAIALAEGAPISVIAAGERWSSPHDRLRPAVEDLLGAGAILAALDPSAAVSPPCCSPEAAAARAAFIDARPRLREILADCASGRELAGRGLADGVEMGADLDASGYAAVLVDGAFMAFVAP